MSKIKFMVSDKSTRSSGLELNLDVKGLLSLMVIDDIVDFLLEYESHGILLERIGIEACKNYFNMKGGE
jgi:hypothetical protein